MTTSIVNVFCQKKLSLVSHVDKLVGHREVHAAELCLPILLLMHKGSQVPRIVISCLIMVMVKLLKLTLLFEVSKN